MKKQSLRFLALLLVLLLALAPLGASAEAASSPAELTNWRDVQSLYLSYSYAVALRSNGTVLIAGQLPEG